METSAGRFGGTEISRKTRSLDLQSLYKSTVSEKEGENKRKSGAVDDGEVRKNKRKSRKEVSLSSFEPVGKRSRKHLDYVCGNGANSDHPNYGGSQLGLSRKLDSSSGFNNISLNLNESGIAIQIPKRRRGSVGRKKFESSQVSGSFGISSIVSGSVDQIAKLKNGGMKCNGNQVSKRLGPLSGKPSPVDQIEKLNDGTGGKVVSSKVKVVESGDVKEKADDSGTTTRVNPARHAKEKDGHLVVNNGDSSSRKCHSNQRKRKQLASGSESLAKKVEPPVDSSIKLCDDSPNEDEENLEQNAARMLSSRFDPSCTGFPSKSRSSASSGRNGLTVFVPSGQGFARRRPDSLADLESESVDSASRILRPRKQHKEKGLSRKRRHFYELLSKDLDVYWVLNRRIKVFWPLDQSWYYGLVNDYDLERKLHHVKYDDRDEEWINLQNERFKLLLLPSEVPRKIEAKRATIADEPDDHEEKDFPTDDDSFNYKDSEPIISWLVRSSGRVKSSPLGFTKRHKTLPLSSSVVPVMLSSKIDDSDGCLDTGCLENEVNTPSCSSAFQEVLTCVRRVGNTGLEGASSSKNSKSPVVYFRRRFRKKDDDLFSESEDKNLFTSTRVLATSLAPFVQGFHASKVYDIRIGDKDTEGLLWSVDNPGLWKLNVLLLDSKTFRFDLCSISVLRYIFGAENSWLLHTVWLLHYGTIMTTWPKVYLEMLFVDNIVGLRFLLFESCLQQAVAFVFLVLTVFHQPKEQGMYVDMQMPVTSIRFKLSCIEDRGKQHVFSFYCFSRVKYSKWLYLDCKLKQHSLLTKQLPLSECTYDNIKALEGGCHQLQICHGDRKSSSEGMTKKSRQGIFSIGAFRESCGVAMKQSSSHCDAKRGKFLPFALSFAAAPTFFLSLHLQLLMETSVACISLLDQDCYPLDHSANTSRSNAFCSLNKNHPENVSEISTEVSQGNFLREAESFGWLPHAKLQVETDAISNCNDCHLVNLSQNFQTGNNGAGTSALCRDTGQNTVHMQSRKSGDSILGSEQVITLPQPLVAKHHLSATISDSWCNSSLTGLSVEIPSLDQLERIADDETPIATKSADMVWNMSCGIVRSPNPTGPRSVWHYNRNSSSPSFGDTSYLQPNVKVDFFSNSFRNGPKKPRTQVQYTIPSEGFDYSSKQKTNSQRGFSVKRIRKANEKRISDGYRNSHRNLELVACDANVLITVGDRGWRECGGRVVLEYADHNEWKLAVKFSGTSKYSCKAHHILQAGSTNRYTLAMMWRGGKDWVLEFPDRSQWMLFKEMHEECHKRNIRAASVKNIPIPGVRLIEESDDNGTDVPFVRISPKYFCQVETDVDMALDSSRILYDMDSDDEQWISEFEKSSHDDGSKCEEISEQLFEKTMDMFEKVAYVQHSDHLTSDEIEEFMVGVGPMKTIKAVHEHWRLKRQRKGMPLIRHLQPPLWERYDQQLKEHGMAKPNPALANGGQEKASHMEKPPMFAFCLRPRGLEVPNKGSKQRSQRKYPVSGHSHALLSDLDRHHGFGRRSNRFAFGDENSDASPMSSRVFSPRDASGSAYYSLNSDWSEWNHHPKLHRNKAKKIGTLLSPNKPHMVSSYDSRTIGSRNGVHRWNMSCSEWPDQKHYQSEGSRRHGIEQLDGSDLDEFRLRDAAGAAHHALNMAKLKRERAQRLLYRADLAIHKAVVALMTADAIKASSEDSSNGDG